MTTRLIAITKNPARVSSDVVPATMQIIGADGVCTLAAIRGDMPYFCWAPDGDDCTRWWFSSEPPPRPAAYGHLRTDWRFDIDLHS